jgi:tetratricopeptide (TPR) repeat protein
MKGLTIRNLRTSLVWILLVVSGPQLATSRDLFDPSARSLSEVEIHACKLAASYLRDGPDVWISELADEASPLRVPGEIELRAGPRQGARWRLMTLSGSPRNVAAFRIDFPSGLREELLLEFSSNRDGPPFQLKMITASWEIPSSMMATAKKAGSVGQEFPEVELRRKTPGFSLAASLREALPSSLVAIVVFFLLAWWSKRWLPALVCGIGGGVLTLWGYSHWPPSPVTQSPANEEGRPLESSASLLELRRAAALGLNEVSLIEGRPAALLWQAERALLSNRLQDAERLLAKLPQGYESAKSAWLNAELASLRNQSAAAARNLEKWLAFSPRSDLALFEASQTMLSLGFESRAEGVLTELRGLGSRWPDVHSFLARFALVEGDVERSAHHFQVSWRLWPPVRQELLKDPLASFLLLQNPDSSKLLALDSSKEPEFGCLKLSERPLRLQPPFEAFLVGSTLIVDIDEGRLVIPNACQLVGSEVQSLGGTAWRQREMEASLAGKEAEKKKLSQPESWGDARLRLYGENMLTALIENGRSDEVLALAESLNNENIVLLKAETVNALAATLRRKGQAIRATNLLLTLALHNKAQAKSDPQTLFHLTELLVGQQEHALALRMLAKAQSLIPFEVDSRRTHQIVVEQRLLETSLIHETDRFKIYYPLERPLSFAREVGEILEAERRRLSRYVPGDHPRSKTDVFLLEIDDFRNSYGGLNILGLFDGRIRTPLGNVQRFNSEIISILTHELAHAMISSATADQTPHWFHEGLAQHLEPGRRDANPIPTLLENQTWMSFSLVDAAIEGFAAAEFAQLGYEESVWAVRFIETRGGISAIHNLLEAYRSGLTDEQALRKTIGMSSAAFDQALREWGKTPELLSWANPPYSGPNDKLFVPPRSRPDPPDPYDPYRRWRN